MRAVRKAGTGVEVVDVPAPTGDGVRVRIRSAGICGSDLHLLRSEFDLPNTLGHEMAGVTDDGTPVAIEPLRPCGACPHCRSGEYNLCALGPDSVIGMAYDGGMADEIVVPARCLVPLATGVSTADALLVEPLAVAVHGMRRIGLRANRRVVVVGGGSIGLCAVAAAAAAGAEVSLVARHDAQNEAGERLGTTPVTGAYDVAIDASGTPGGVTRAIELCRPHADLLLLGTYWDGFELPGMLLCAKEVNLVPAMTYARDGVARDIDVAAGVLAANAEIPRAIITHRFPLEAAVEAFEVAADRKAGAIKVVLEPRY